MKKSNDTFEYIGDELHFFKEAVTWKKYFSNKLKKNISGDVLEVGAGIGGNSKFLLPQTKTVSSWCLLEPDEKLIKEIEKNTLDVDLPAKKIINGTISSVSDRTFDTIIYIDVLEHIEHSKEEMARAKKLLNPGGSLIILVPAYNFLYSNFDKKIGHFRRYNKQLLLDELNGGNPVEKLFYLDSFGFVASLFNKLVLKKELPTQGNIKFWDTYLVSMSKILDVIVLNGFGKSLIGIYKNEK